MSTFLSMQFDGEPSPLYTREVAPFKYTHRDGHTTSEASPIREVIVVSPATLDEFNKAAAEMHVWAWCNKAPGLCGPRAAQSHGACVLPWTVHWLVFAPCVWCVPMLWRSCHPREERIAPPLTLTSAGLHDGVQGLGWDNIGQMTLLKTQDVSCGQWSSGDSLEGSSTELACALGCGVCAACCHVMICNRHVPGYFSILINSQSTHQVTRRVRGRNGSIQTYDVPDVYLSFEALDTDPHQLWETINAAGIEPIVAGVSTPGQLELPPPYIDHQAPQYSAEPPMEDTQKSNI